MNKQVDNLITMLNVLGNSGAYGCSIGESNVRPASIVSVWCRDVACSHCAFHVRGPGIFDEDKVNNPHETITILSPKRT